MGNNFFTKWVDSVTKFRAVMMNAPLEELDKAVTRNKNTIIHCDGSITYSAGTLSWDATIRILHNTATGNIVQNTIASGSIALSDNEFAYVTLSDTNDAVLTVSKASVTTNAASNTIAVDRLVLGYRNTTSDEFYPVALKIPVSEAPHVQLHDIDSSSDHNGVSGAVEDNFVSFDASGLPKDSGVASTAVHAQDHDLDSTSDHNGVAGATEDNFISFNGSGLPKDSSRSAASFLDGREQEITCANSVTVDWANGATARMTFDRNTVALTLSNGVNGKVYRLLLIQGDGSDTLTYSTTIYWSGGATPVLSTAAGARDIITFVYINSTWYGSATLNFATV